MLLSLTPTQFITKKDVPVIDELWLDINSTGAGIEHVNEFTDFMKRAWHIEESPFMNIQGALYEAIMNAAAHGNKWDEDKQIHIHAQCHEEYFIISVTDEGDEFNSKDTENPTSAENRIKPGGRGIFLMNFLADHMQFLQHGKCVKLFFRNTKKV